MTGIGGGLLGLGVAGVIGLVGEPTQTLWLGVMGSLTGAGAGLGVGFWPAGPITTPTWAVVGGVAGGLAGAYAVLPSCGDDPRCGSTAATAALLGAAGGAAIGAMLTRKPRRRWGSVTLSGLGIAGTF